MPTLDVILTQTTTALTPKQADFLAQASNQGGGEHDKSHAPARHPVRHRAASPTPASRRANCARSRRRRSRRRRRAWSAAPRGETRVAAAAGHAARRANGRCRRAARRSSTTWRWRGWPPRSTCARSATPSGRQAQVRLGQHPRIRLGRPTCARGSTGSSASATSTIPDEARRRRIGGAGRDQRRRSAATARSSAPTSCSPAASRCWTPPRCASPRWPSRIRRCRRPRRTRTSSRRPAPGSSCRAATLIDH